MIDVTEAVKTRWDSQSLSSSITGGVWHTEAPENISYPYCIYNELGSPKITSTRTKYYCRFSVQFDVYTDDGNPSTSGDLATSIVNAFDGASQAQTSKMQPTANAVISETYLASIPSSRCEGGDVYRTYFRLGMVVEVNKTPVPG